MFQERDRKPWVKSQLGDGRSISALEESVGFGGENSPSKHREQRASAKPEAAFVKGLQHFVHHLSLEGLV